MFLKWKFFIIFFQVALRTLMTEVDKSSSTSIDEIIILLMIFPAVDGQVFLGLTFQHYYFTLHKIAINLRLKIIINSDVVELIVLFCYLKSLMIYDLSVLLCAI